MNRSLHSKFVFKALAVPSDSGDGESPSAAPKYELAVMFFDPTVQIQLVPPFGVTDVIKRKIVLAGPEERHRVKPLAAAEYVPCRRLSLAFGQHPVLDANIGSR